MADVCAKRSGSHLEEKEDEDGDDHDDEGEGVGKGDEMRMASHRKTDTPRWYVRTGCAGGVRKEPTKKMILTVGEPSKRVLCFPRGALLCTSKTTAPAEYKPKTELTPKPSFVRVGQTAHSSFNKISSTRSPAAPPDAWP